MSHNLDWFTADEPCYKNCSISHNEAQSPSQLQEVTFGSAHGLESTNHLLAASHFETRFAAFFLVY